MAVPPPGEGSQAQLPRKKENTELCLIFSFFVFEIRRCSTAFVGQRGRTEKAIDTVTVQGSGSPEGPRRTEPKGDSGQR